MPAPPDQVPYSLLGREKQTAFLCSGGSSCSVLRTAFLPSPRLAMKYTLCYIVGEGPQSSSLPRLPVKRGCARSNPNLLQPGGAGFAEGTAAALQAEVGKQQLFQDKNTAD